MNVTRLTRIPDAIRGRLTDRLARRSREPDENGCVLWAGPVDRGGYAKFSVSHQGVKVYTSAHRVAWMLANGEVRDGYVLDHLCRNRACVNPEHLEMVSHLENVRRGAIPIHNRAELGASLHRPTSSVAERAFCPNGHAWVAENIAIYTNKAGHNEVRCRPCRRESNAIYRANKAGLGIAPSPEYQRGKYAA